MADISICLPKDSGNKRTHITSTLKYSRRRKRPLAHSAIARQRVTIRNRLDLPTRHRTTRPLEIERLTTLIERAIIDATFQVRHHGLPKSRPRNRLIAQNRPRAIKRIRVGLSIETLGTQIVGGDGAVVGAVRGNGGLEIGPRVGVVAREVGQWGALCARERNTGAVIEEGAVLDAPVKRVGVGC